MARKSRLILGVVREVGAQKRVGLRRRELSSRIALEMWSNESLYLCFNLSNHYEQTTAWLGRHHPIDDWHWCLGGPT